MPDQPLTRDAWVNDFTVAVQRLRPDLVHSLKYIAAVAQSEWGQEQRQGRSARDGAAVEQAREERQAVRDGRGWSATRWINPAMEQSKGPTR